MKLLASSFQLLAKPQNHLAANSREWTRIKKLKTARKTEDCAADVGYFSKSRFLAGFWPYLGGGGQFEI